MLFTIEEPIFITIALSIAFIADDYLNSSFEISLLVKAVVALSKFKQN